ncbi:MULTISPECIES: hypothetical protein [Nocardia]|uniref:hypothetical protein n=1 Tax=Nocardia TaxID=1817 RepID=UPI00163DE4FF|nr:MULTISPECIES: hypothetical protein [Nocardia]MBF6177618.1 hypothetical protein [Nocardia otitidiscaviarum]MCP9623561.1 hypothetical protein [Nocardia otitidiscaviarum]
MCSPVRCRTCGKTTWSGCGHHVAQVRAAVPADQWCPGHQTDTDRGWLRRLRNR